LASSQTFRLIKALVKYAIERLVSTEALKCPRSRPRPRWLGLILGNLPHVEAQHSLHPGSGEMRLHRHRRETSQNSVMAKFVEL
jgi:hypothetical protein